MGQSCCTTRDDKGPDLPKNSENVALPEHPRSNMLNQKLRKTPQKGDEQPQPNNPGQSGQDVEAVGGVVNQLNGLALNDKQDGKVAAGDPQSNQDQGQMQDALEEGRPSTGGGAATEVHGLQAQLAEPRGTAGTEFAFTGHSIQQSHKLIDFVMPCQKQFFDEPNENFTGYFEYLEFERVGSIELSGNSYGKEACRWIAENVLSKCVNLRKVNFSDIFTTRERKDLPPALKLMIDAIIDKPIVEVNLSDNAFGPDGVSSYVAFLEQSPTLEVLNLTNCGLGPIGGQMLAEAILKNENMKLKEFYGSRGRLENAGIEALSKVFSKHKTLQKIEVYQSGIRMGLSPLFKALVDCRATIEYVDVSDNLIKRDVAELGNFIKSCTNVKYLNLSDSLIKRKQQSEVFDALIQNIRGGSKLEHIVWNQDPKKSAVGPFIEQLKDLGQTNLRKVQMAGIFMKRENRAQLKEKLGATSIELELFKPDFSDDESEDHDDSEDESSEDDGEESSEEKDSSKEDA